MARGGFTALLVACTAIVAIQAFVGAAVPTAIALAAGMLAPVGLLGATVPAGRRTSVALAALAVVLLAVAALVPWIHRRVSSGAADANEIAGLLLALLALAGIAPAIVLAWAHAEGSPDGRP